MSILFNNNTIKDIYVKQDQLQKIIKGFIKSDGTLKQFYSKQNEEQEGLPDGYQQVEYIYNNAGAYIDTEIKGCYTYKCVFKDIGTSSNYRVPFGIRYINTSNHMSINEAYEILEYNDYFTIYYLSKKQNKNTNINQIITVLYNIEPNHTIQMYDENDQKIYEVTYTDELTTDYFNDINLTLFTRNFHSISSSYNQYQHQQSIEGLCIYSFEVYSNPSMGEKIAKFVPCKNPSGVVGMYNLIGRKFHPNAGSENNGGLLAAGDPNIPI